MINLVYGYMPNLQKGGFFTMAEFGLSITMDDAYQRRTVRGFTIEAVDHAAALTAAGLFLADYADATGCDILWYKVAEKVVYTDTPTAESNKDAGVTISVRKADNEKAPIKIPAPEAAYLNPDGTVDLTDTIVTQLASHFLSGTIRVSDHEVVTAFLSGRLDE
jgi:hypothetical protein